MYLWILYEAVVFHTSSTSAIRPFAHALAFVPGFGQGEERCIDQMTDVNVGITRTKILK